MTQPPLSTNCGEMAISALKKPFCSQLIVPISGMRGSTPHSIREQMQGAPPRSWRMKLLRWDINDLNL